MTEPAPQGHPDPAVRHAAVDQYIKGVREGTLVGEAKIEAQRKIWPEAEWPSAETRTEHWLRRGKELHRSSKAQLCRRYRSMGGLGGAHPPEKWRKDEVVTSIIEIEWSRLPAEAKKPDPPVMCPPCDRCGKGEDDHPHGHDHLYVNTYDPQQQWIPSRSPAE